MSNSNICKHLSTNENERGMDNGIVDWYCFYQENYIDPSECINCGYRKLKTKRNSLSSKSIWFL